MQIQVLNSPFDKIEAAALAVVVFENTDAVEPAAAADLDQRTSGWIKESLSSGEFTGKTGETLVLARPGGLKAARLVLVGGGKADKFDAAEMRRAAGTAVRALQTKKIRNIAMVLHDAQYASAAVEGAITGSFEPDQYKTDPKKDECRLDSFTVVSPADVAADVDRGRILGESQNFARDLINEPGNMLTPTLLAERARKMAEEQGLECEILGPERMTQLGMGSLMGVAQGSAEPPALIVLRYKPASATSDSHLGLVGKGVTFDTGGISIKPADGMEKMKYDMAGGAAVIGAMRAIALLKPSVTVTALIPTVENMPGSKAQRPGDIVKALSGKTIEVLNTDAEGRLILCDAIEYAKRLGCTHLVDAATLTGAIVVALGMIRVGVFTNNEPFRDQFLVASEKEGERMWSMPLDDDYREMLKTPFADIANIGNRWGGAITAAMFLKEFADPTPWVHLDIAGTAWNDEQKPYLAKGPSGVCVRTFVRLAMEWK